MGERDSEAAKGWGAHELWGRRSCMRGKGEATHLLQVKPIVVPALLRARGVVGGVSGVVCACVKEGRSGGGAEGFVGQGRTRVIPLAQTRPARSNRGRRPGLRAYNPLRTS